MKPHDYLLWGFVGTVVILLAMLAFGCLHPAAIRSFPLPLDASMADYLVAQTVQDCGATSILVSIVEKDSHRYLLVGSELDATGLARWAMVELTDDPAKSYLWKGTATSDSRATVVSGRSFAIPDQPDMCSWVAPLDKA